MVTESLPGVQQAIAIAETKATPARKLPDNNDDIDDNDVMKRDNMPVIDGGEVSAVLNTVAVTWAPLHQSSGCHACGRVLMSEAWAQSRTHCRRCGHLFCRRCCLLRVALPGHESGKPVPVCNQCNRVLRRARGEETDSNDDDSEEGHSERGEGMINDWM